MDRNILDFTFPAWWIIPCLILAAGLSYLLYSKKGLPWSRNQNLLLGILRFSAIFLILLLFLEPLIRKITNEVERPIIVLAVDNSASISTIHDQDQRDLFVRNIQNLEEELSEAKDYQVAVKTLEWGDSLSFDDAATNYSDFFRRMEEVYSGKNLSAVVLASDGIFNRGSSPAHKTFTYPVYSLGLGDTIPRRDVALTNVRSNRVAYSGNEFPILLELSSEGFEGRNVDVRIEERGSLIESRNEELKSSGNQFTFFLTAASPGLKHYTISITEFDDEMTYENNTHEVFIEILESKKRVLISGLSPHPDMRAIRSALEVTGNYEVVMFIRGIQDSPEVNDFDVQILFDGVEPQPGKSGNWIINSNMSGTHFEQVPFLRFDSEGPPDNASPSLNPDFTKFKLNREPSRLGDYPPIQAPFGTYDLAGPYEVLFYQRVGSVVTEKPLMVVFDDGAKRLALSVGQGIWQWRLQEAARNEETLLFTELIQKLVQFLSINDSKKQFSVERTQEVFTQGEVVTFDVEIYDDIFQSLEGQPYSLEITNERNQSRQFEYVYGKESDQARTTSFEAGTYTYKARTQVGDKTLSEEGEFVVNALQLEQRELTADHNLLRRISEKSGGDYFHFSQFESLKESLRETDFKGVIHTDNSRQPLININWILILIASMLSAEWILRKVWGAY